MEGERESVCFIRVNRGDWVQSCCVFSLIRDLWACFAADLLCGRTVSNGLGSLLGDALLFVMALFAKRSAASLPSTPMCAGTHLIWVESLGILFRMLLTAAWNASMR